MNPYEDNTGVLTNTPRPQIPQQPEPQAPRQEQPAPQPSPAGSYGSASPAQDPRYANSPYANSP